MALKKYYLLLLLITGSMSLHAQQGVHGALTVTGTSIVNEYTAITANVAVGATSITVANSALNTNGRFTASLQPGDLIMIYQVQGVWIRNQFDVGPTDTTWGKIQSQADYYNCGNYEFRQVVSVPNATTINIDCGTSKPYSTGGIGHVSQVVRVPRYTSLTVNAGATLTCDDWNGTIGGILAVEVQGNTVINGTVDATGKGFRGGSLVGDNVTSFGVNTTYSTNNTLGAEKGEGVVGYQTSYSAFGGQYCRAPATNGGGGGDAHNGGGGGGANAPNSTSGTAVWSGNGVPDQSVAGWTTAWNREPPINTMSLRTNVNSAGGGRGGYTFSDQNQNATVTGPGNGAWGGDARNHEATGLGGRPLDYSTGKIFFGGGGGAGDQNQGYGGIGGDGGGLIYIMGFGTISGSGTVTANGNNGVDATGPPPAPNSYGGRDAAGGGGGGGTVILNAVGGVAGITANANGGNGGSQILTRGAFYVGAINEAEGPGGGGGGGYIAVSSGAITRNSNGGNNGTTNSDAITEFLPNGATKGCPGTNNAAITNFDISLTNQTICAGTSATIPVTVTGTPPAGYVINWYNVAVGGAPFFTGATYTTPVLAVGTYTYYVGTCAGWWREPVVITVVGSPTATITASANPICSGQSVTLTAGGANTYTWMPGSLTGSSVTVTPGSTTTYTVTGTLTAGGCSDTETITITVNPTPTVTASASSVTICAGQSTTLTGGGATSYTWNPGAIPGSPVSVSPAATTTYTVTGTSLGCTDTETITITVNALPTVTSSASTNPICVGGSTNLTGGGASTYVWNPGALPGSPVTVTPAATTTYTVTGTGANGCTNTSQLTVTVSPTPTVTATAGTNPICSGNSATLTASGATTYNWMPGSLSGATVTVTPASTTSYTVTGTTGTCTSTFVLTVTVNPSPTVTSTAATNPICAGSTTTLTAGGASTYVWNPGSLPGNPVSVTPGSTTTYTVTGTAANGCTATSQLTVTVNPLPSVTATTGTNPICSGNSATLTGGGATSYVWNPGAISGSPITVTPASTTTYTVTGTGANGCTNTAQLTVTVAPTPTVTATAGTNPICSGNSTTLTASGATTYNWMPGSLSGSSVTVSPAANTTYTVTGTTGTCTSTFVLTVTVNPSPTVTSTSGTNPICAGASTTLTAGGASTYNWNPGSMSGSSVSVSPPSTTTYTVTGTAANGCTGTSQLTVTVNPLPTVTLTPASAAICSGSSVTVTASGANSYSWSPGPLSGGSQTLSPSSGTTFTVTGTDGNGCTDTAQVAITVNALPIVTASSSASAICAGNSVTLTSNGASSYVWNPGSLIGSSVADTPGSTTTYTVTGTDGNGCTDTAQVTVVVNPLPVPTATATPPSICFGQSVSLTSSGGTTYTWNGGSLSNASGATQTDTPAATITYSVVVSDANGCSDSTTVAVTVNALPVANAGADQSICIGSSANINGTGGGTYTWNGGSLVNASGSSQTDNPSVTTDYELLVTDGNGCTDTDSIRIVVNALPIVSAGTDVQICLNSTTQLTGTGASAYVWTPATGLDDDSIANPNATPLLTTTYVVTGTDANGCVNTDSVVVSIGSNLTVLISPDVTICPGDTAQLSVANGTTWTWSPPATLGAPSSQTTDAFPVSTTTYTVNIADANGCQGTDSVTVFINTNVALTATGNTTICIGDSATLTASPSGGTAPYTYIWDNSLTGGSPQVVSPTATTVYNVYVTDSIGCNSPVQTLTVTVNPPLTLAAIANDSACVGGSITVVAAGAGGDGNLQYTWYPGALTGASQTFTVNATTTYTVILSDGCTTPPDTTTVTVTALQAPTVSLSSNIQTGCGPLCVDFSATSSSSCVTSAWQFGDGNTSTQSTPANCYVLSGSYNVTYTCTDVNGCVGTVTSPNYITVYAYPTASFSMSSASPIQIDPTAQICMTDQSTGAIQWQWDVSGPTGSQSSTVQNPCFTVSDTGSYTVTLVATNSFGCTDTTVMTFTAENPCGDIFVPNAFSPNGDNQNDTLFIYGGCIDFMQFEIYSRWGEQVFISTVETNGWDGTWRGKPCEAGVFTYVLRGQTTDGEPIEMQGNINLIR